MLKQETSRKAQCHLSIRMLVIALVIGAVATVAIGWTAAQAGDDLPEWRGKVTTMPADKTGEWVIGGKTFTAGANTEFDELEGELGVGVCAKVKYEDVSGTLYAHKIDSEPAGDCGGPGNDDKDDGMRRFGRIDEMPQGGREGDWVIGGVKFRATTNTEFEPEHGAFHLGACVKVESEAATPRIAKQIETEHQYRCMGNGTEPPKAEMYGTVTDFPAGLIGKWMIGGMEFMADGNTEFDQENGPFENGVTVRVRFQTDDNDGHHALEIETKYAKGDDDDDHHRYGQEGHAFGIVEGLPPGQSLLGPWTVSDIVYDVNTSTELEDEDESYTVGARVRVEYHTDDTGKRIADEIEITEDKGDVKDDSHTKLLGFAEKMPAAGFNGTWQIAGADFMVNGNSVLKEEHGLFGTGAYVEVEYSIVANQRMVHEMETQAPPGAGDRTDVGVITSIDDSTQAAAIQVADANQWIIGGETYTVLAATQLDDGTGDLAVGGTAIVNSYIANDGRAVATSIQGIVFGSQVYLPLASR